MTAQDIIAKIVEWDKDVTYTDVAELIDGKANVDQLPFIKNALYNYVSSNEMNASRFAIMHIG